jgi:xylulokinase
MSMAQPLWAEQRPENWWEASCAALRGVLHAAGISGREVRGIGLSGQMHGLTLLDSQNRVLRPALIWCDQRSQPQVDWINRNCGSGVRRRIDREPDADRVHTAEAAVGARPRVPKITD